MKKRIETDTHIIGIMKHNRSYAVTIIDKSTGKITSKEYKKEASVNELIHNLEGK